MIYVLFFHILGASVWTGGHLIICLRYLPRVLRSRDAAPLLAFEERFEPLGLGALLVQIITGWWLARIYVSDASLLLEPSHVPAMHVSAKIALVLITLGLAAHARLRLIPRLTPERLPLLAAHIIAVTVVAVLLVLTGVSFRAG